MSLVSKIFAFLLLLCLTPFIFIIAFVILIDSGLPIIFSQKRIGQNKSVFIVHKFRTMKNHSITRSGKILRKMGLDEIPQLINIILGTMAFIGPRPLTEYDITRLGWNDDKYKKRWNVKPGITGMAQLSKVCDPDLTMQKDLYYVEHKSLILDFQIFLKTLKVPFLGKRTN